MSSFKKLEVNRFPRKNPQITPETRYWQQFGKTVKTKLNAKISSIEFCSAAPHDFAITCSSRVEVYDPNSCTVKKTISRFKDVAFSGSFRKDGKLLVAGSANGTVQVFDMASRSILRKWNEHQGECHVTKFSTDGEHILSCGDDKTVKLLSLPSESVVSTLVGHDDYIRCGFESPTSVNTWYTGSYDHTIKCWDTRTKNCVMTINHEAPVESLLILPSGGLLISAGGTELKVWDLLAGGKLVDTVRNHQKVITSLAMDVSATRIFSASLDHHVKIYDVANFAVTHSLKYNSEVTSVALSPDSTTLAVGMLDGTLDVRRRVTKQVQTVQEKRAIRTGTRQFFMRGQAHTPLQEDYQVTPSGKKQKLKSYDRYLRKFQYGIALDAALQTRQAAVVASVIDELVQRGALKQALSDRKDESLQSVLNFLIKQIDNPQYTSILLDVVNIILGTYTRVVGQSVVIDELLHKLKKKVSAEVEFQKCASQMLGTLGILLASTADGGLAAAAPLSSQQSSADYGSDSNHSPVKKQKV